MPLDMAWVVVHDCNCTKHTASKRQVPLAICHMLLHSIFLVMHGYCFIPQSCHTGGCGSPYSAVSLFVTCNDSQYRNDA